MRFIPLVLVAAAIGVVVLGLGLAVWPDRKTSLLNEAADPKYQSAHPVARISADELAFAIVDGDARLLPVDVRDAAEFAKTSLPGAVNIQPASMLGKEWRETLGHSEKRKIFFAQDEAAAVRAATLAVRLGYKNVAALAGGLQDFEQTVLRAPAPTETGSETEQATARFRPRAAGEIATLIKQRGGVKTERKIKRVQGGCGS